MKSLKTPLLIISCLVLLIGLIWIGQGTGYFPYPRESFMISRMPWAWRGAGLAIAAFIGIRISRKL